jgi:hypothetical protein
MSDLSPLSGVKRKSDFGAVRAAFDPNRTNYDQRVGLKLLQLELLGAKARGLAIA